MGPIITRELKKVTLRLNNKLDKYMCSKVYTGVQQTAILILESFAVYYLDVPNKYCSLFV